MPGIVLLSQAVVAVPIQEDFDTAHVDLPAIHRRYGRRKTKVHYWFPLVAVCLLFVYVPSLSQPVRTYTSFFEAAITAKSPQVATFYAKRACALAIKAGKPAVALRYNVSISAAFYEQHHYLAGIRLCQEGMRLARQHDLISDTLSFRYYGLLAAMYSRLTMNDSAAYWYHQTDLLLGSKPGLERIIPADIEACYYNEGFFYMRLGDQQRAVEYIKKSVEMAGRFGDKRSKALSDLQLANYYFSVYQYSEAAIQYRKALNGFAPESVDACWGYALLGNCFRAGQKPALGLTLLRISRKKYASILAKDPSRQDANFAVESSYYLAKCEQVMGFDAAASRSYQAAIKTYRHAYGNRGELIAAGWTGLAAIALKKKRIDRAMGLVQKAILAATVVFSQTNPDQNPAPDDVKAGKALYEALRLKGDIWYKLYKSTGNPSQVKQAIQTFRVGLQVAQRLRRSFTQLEATYFFNEKIQPCLEDALEATFDWHNQSNAPPQTAAIFDLLQAYQAMGLADALHQKDVKRETMSAQLLQEEQDMRQKLVAAETQLINQPTAPNRILLMTEVSALKRRLYLFEDQLVRKSPRYDTLKYADQLLPLTVLQSKLDDQTAYVSYFTGERFIYGFFATRSQVLVFRRVMTPAFAPAVAALRVALAYNPGMLGYEGQPAANRLFEYLISPIEAHLKPLKRLIIERDGLLNNIPFEVLEARGQPEAYLCKRFALSYSYAARLTFTTALPPANSFRHPVGFAPYSDDSAAREKIIPPQRLLRQSAAEAREAGGTVYVNAQATKVRFLGAIGQASLLHLATHATADDVHPEASSIGFYPNTADSLLRASEIVNLPLNHIRLTVLSACEGNTGVLRKAEGVLSLARAFRLAGCPTILTTTWSAHNGTTSELIRLFYHYAHQGLPADVALQQARLDYFSSSMFNKWGHPYHWANLTLIGNPDVSLPATELVSEVNGLLIVLLLTGGLLFFIGRRLRAQPVGKPDLPPNLPAVD